MSSLFCWFDWEDNTTTVNSINIIKEPRKPLNEYKKGDKVLAKLPQFGLWNGEIVEISGKFFSLYNLSFISCYIKKYLFKINARI